MAAVANFFLVIVVGAYSYDDVMCEGLDQFECCNVTCEFSCAFISLFWAICPY